MISDSHARWGIFSVAAVLFCMSVQAQTPEETPATFPQSQYGLHKPFGDAYAAAKSVAQEQTRLVVYRAPSDAADPVDAASVISVYLNDRYHASLQKDAFSVVCLDTPQAEVRTRFLSSLTAELRPERDARHTVAMAGGHSIFLRVAHTADHKSRIELVSAQTAGEDLVNARQQKHTLSRVPGVQACREAKDTRMALEPKGLTQGAGPIFQRPQGEISAQIQ